MMQFTTPMGIKRQLAFDASRCDEALEVCHLAGISPISAEVAEMEHQASHDRFDKIGPIMPLVVTLSHLLGEIFAALEIDDLDDPDDLSDATCDADKEAILEERKRIILHSSVAILSQLAELDLINVGMLHA